MDQYFQYDSGFDPSELYGAEASESPSVCPFFAQGNCRFGSKCWYQHPSESPVCGDRECNICFLKVKMNNRQFGLLLGCPHIFCLPCIRQWRGQLNVPKQTSKSCPICRVPSHYIVPSADPVLDYKAKVSLSENYKKHLSSVACAKFNNGEGECPFGSSCFYEHLNKDGSKWEAPKPDFVCDEDGVWQVYQRPKLSDFIK